MKICEKIKSFIFRIVNKLENQKITLTQWLFIFSTLFFIRTFYEIFSSRNINFIQVERWYGFFFHTSSFFFFCILFVILLLHFLIKEKLEKVCRVVLFAFLIILLLSIIDFIVSGGDRMVVAYLSFTELLSSILILIGIIWYIFLKTKDIFRVLLGILAMVCLGFIVISSFYTIVLTRFSSLNSDFGFWHTIATLYFIYACFLASIWFYFYKKEKFLSLFKNLRLSRTVNNIMLLGLGLFLGGILSFDLNFSDWLLVILAVISLLLYWFSAIGYDDIFDEKIDRISNSFRPLPQGKFTKEEFRKLSNLFRAASYYSAFAIGYTFFGFILLRSLLGYFYSFPPFRLKRFPILATFIKASAFLSTVYAGFVLISKNTIFDFPAKLAIFILVAFTLGATVKDIRDYRGDKAGEIYTIPAIFGLEKGKKIIGFFSFIVFVLCPLFFFDYFKVLIVPALLAASLSFYLIQEKMTKLNSVCLFLIYFSFGIFFILICF